MDGRLSWIHAATDEFPQSGVYGAPLLRSGQDHSSEAGWRLVGVSGYRLVFDNSDG